MVQRVESLRPELQLHAFRDIESLHDAQIHVPVWSRTENVAAGAVAARRGKYKYSLRQSRVEHHGPGHAGKIAIHHVRLRTDDVSARRMRIVVGARAAEYA